MELPIVAVTEPQYRKAEETFSTVTDLHCVPAPEEEQALAATVRRLGARHAIVGLANYKHALYSSLPERGVLARYGVGHDGIDKAKASGCGLLCTNTPGVLDQSVAEHTMFLIGAAARHLISAATAMAQSEWAPRSGAELNGKTLVIVGLGPIGRSVGRIAALGFGMRTIGVVRASASSAPEGFTRITDDFDEAASEADFLSLHIPATPINTRFLNARRIAQLQKHAWVINTARGAVLDEDALHTALHSGKIAGAALDVFEREPYSPRDTAQDLRALRNVILTPHVGSNTTEANRRIAERTLANIRFAESGSYDRMDLLNPQALR